MTTFPPGILSAIPGSRSSTLLSMTVLHSKSVSSNCSQGGGSPQSPKGPPHVRRRGVESGRTPSKFLLPFECAFSPCIDQTQEKDKNEGDHLDKPGHSEAFKGDGPGIQEKRLDIKKDKQEGENIKADVELDPWTPNRLRAAFIGGPEDRIMVSDPKKP